MNGADGLRRRFGAAGHRLAWLTVPGYGWRPMFVITGLGALGVWYLHKNLPESPRWLEAKGRAGEAEALMQRIEREAAGGFALPPPVPARLYRGAVPEVRLCANGICNMFGHGATILTPLIVVVLFNACGVAGVLGFMIALLVVQIARRPLGNRARPPPLRGPRAGGDRTDARCGGKADHGRLILGRASGSVSETELATIRSDPLSTR